MKLIQKSNRTQLKVILGVLPLAGIVLFAVLNYFIKDEINEKLLVDELRVVQTLEKDNSPPNLYPVIEVSTVSDSSVEQMTFSQDYIFDPIENEDELFSTLQSVRNINGTNYSITIRHSLIETKDLLIAIGIAVGCFVILIVLAFYFINRRIAKKLWEPFYLTLEQLKMFSLEAVGKFDFNETQIDEFNSLNDSIAEMTQKISQDYSTLKEFTENASHEIQTPLSIIMLHLDDAMQSELSEELSETIYKAYQSAKRLSSLNEKLLLLTKIENNQYHHSDAINIGEIIQDKLEEFKPLIKAKNIETIFEKEGEFIHPIDKNLASILIDNLFSNAIKHNIEKGLIEIKISKEEISIKNSTNGKVDERHIFDRFKKGSQSQKSIGLGLSIAKQIADNAHLKLKVLAEEDLFVLKLIQK